MIAKAIEIRDLGTCISALAIKTTPANEAERWLLSRAGYGGSEREQATYVLLGKIDGGDNLRFECSALEWRLRGHWQRLEAAHDWIIDHFDQLEPGAVVDIEFILGETAQPKISDRLR